MSSRMRGAKNRIHKLLRGVPAPRKTVRECEIAEFGSESAGQRTPSLHPERGRRNLKFFDRYLGISLVLLLGFFRKKRRKIGNVNRIALLKTAAIGDTILLSAITKDIKDQSKTAKIVFFAGSNNFDAAKLLPDVDEVVELPIRKPLSCAKLIRDAGEFDVWIDFGSWPRLDALFSFFSRAKHKIGFKTRGQFRHYVYDIPVEHSSSVHEVYNFKNLLKPLGINGANLPSISVEGEFEDSDYIVVHMFPGGTRSYLREWPEENWVSLITFIINSGLKVYLTGAQFDRERAVKLKSEVESEAVKVVAGEMGLKQVALLLKSAKALITVNTGIMHLAAAMGCKVIALNGPSSPLRWGPLGPNSTIIYRNKYGPCMDLGFESKCITNKCMRNITVKDVLEEIKSLKIPQTGVSPI